MSTRRRRSARTASLTPLLDVLFILLFASLIQAHSAVEQRPAPTTEVALEERVDAGVADAMIRDAGVDAFPLGDAGPTSVALASSPDETVHLRRSRVAAEILSEMMLGMDAYTVEVSERGHVFAVSRRAGGEQIERELVDHPLLRRVPVTESDAEYEYIGFNDSGVCGLVRDHFGLPPDASRHAVVMVLLTVPFADLPLVLARGLKRDLVRCLGDGGGIGMLVQPGDEDSHGI